MGLAVGDKVIANHASCLYEEEAYSDLLGAQGKVILIDDQRSLSVLVRWDDGQHRTLRHTTAELVKIEDKGILWTV